MDEDDGMRTEKETVTVTNKQKKKTRPPAVSPCAPTPPPHQNTQGGGGGNPFANMSGIMENMRKAQEEAARVQVELSK